MHARRPSGRVAFAAIFVSISINALAAAESGSPVRPAYSAGFWYPRDPEVLAKTVDDALTRASPPKLASKPIALISPHAGYSIAGPVTAAGYRCLRGHAYKRVIVLAFSHRASGTYRGVDVPRELTAYATPIGRVPIDREVCDELLKRRGFGSHAGVDRGEHSLENQLPFLQQVLTEFRLVPLLVGRMSPRDYAAAAEAIVPHIDDDTLLVASSDFTHYGPNYGYMPFKQDVPAKIREYADRAARAITKCDFDGFADHLADTRDTICGRGPILLLLRILSMRSGAAAVRAAYDTSGNITGDWTNSVTYQSFVFVRRAGRLDAQSRGELLRQARQTVTAYLNGKELPRVDAEGLPAPLRADGACFVTLENDGRLRGCIGNMVAQGPLYQAVIRNAVSACRDSRFVDNPVTAAELNQLHIEISCLTPMRRVSDVDEIIIGRHGLLISLGGRRGVLLPQVAARRGWTREEFLVQTCLKAGLPPDAWKRPAAEIYSFEAEVFGEPEPSVEQPAGGH